jgi:two-component system response regulator FixJ
MSDPPLVYVVDDDPGIRRSLASLLESENLDTEICASGEEFLDTYDPKRAGCLILDVRLRRASGLDLQDELRRRRIALPIIVVAGHGDVATTVRAFRGGALDFLEKPLDPQQLIATVRRAIDSDQQNRETSAGRESVATRLARLTPRERQVMEQLIEGKISKEIAWSLGVSPRTVEGHRRRILEKMDVGSATELTRLVTRAEQGRDG